MGGVGGVTDGGGVTVGGRCGSATVVTRKRDFGKKLVGEQLFDDGGVIGDVPVSTTRDT